MYVFDKEGISLSNLKSTTIHSLVSVIAQMDFLKQKYIFILGGKAKMFI